MSGGAERKKGAPQGAFVLTGGGAEGDRTPDLCNAIAALSQLSYGPVPFWSLKIRIEETRSTRPLGETTVRANGNFALGAD